MPTTPLAGSSMCSLSIFFSDLQVLLALAFRLVVVSCAVQSKNPTLLLDADLAFRGNQSFSGISIPNCLDTRLAKSSCISRSHILRRYLSFCFSNAASSFFGVSNAAAEFSRNIDRNIKLNSQNVPLVSTKNCGRLYKV